MTFLEWLENTLRQIIELTKASANPATYPVAASIMAIILVAGVVITPLIVALIAVRITKKAKKAHLQRQNTVDEFKSKTNKLEPSMSPEEAIKVMGEGYSKCFGTIDYVDSKKGDVYHRNVTIYRWNCGKYSVKAIFNHKNKLQELKTNFIKDDICQMTNEEIDCDDAQDVILAVVHNNKKKIQEKLTFEDIIELNDYNVDEIWLKKHFTEVKAELSDYYENNIKNSDDMLVLCLYEHSAYME